MTELEGVVAAVGWGLDGRELDDLLVERARAGVGGGIVALLKKVDGEGSAFGGVVGHGRRSRGRPINFYLFDENAAFDNQAGVHLSAVNELAADGKVSNDSDEFLARVSVGRPKRGHIEVSRHVEVSEMDPMGVA